jgi:hypothetical protein
MGRQSRLRQQRRRGTAHFSVLSPGMLEVLSVGKGDLKITVGDSNKDRADAQRIIEEMLRKGYTLFVETADGPLKVTRFDPDRMVYVVADTPGVEPEPAPESAGAGEDEPEVRARQAKPRTVTVPVRGSKTTAIGRTAGG